MVGSSVVGEFSMSITIRAMTADDAADFSCLLDAVEHFAVESAHPMVVGGVNQARREAYQAMRKRGSRALAVGVAMHRPDESAIPRPGCTWSTTGGNGIFSVENFKVIL
jgi:hypothetical protein